eukprot:scaffold116074_cov48-Phaeocystis_antarctica.AAC.1
MRWECRRHIRCYHLSLSRRSRSRSRSRSSRRRSHSHSRSRSRSHSSRSRPPAVFAQPWPHPQQTTLPSLSLSLAGDAAARQPLGPRLRRPVQGAALQLDAHPRRRHEGVARRRGGGHAAAPALAPHGDPGRVRRGGG